MADHVDYIDGDISQANRVLAAWLNDVNDLTYGAGNAARGAALLQFIQAGTGGITRDVQEKGRERISALDFIPAALHVAIAARTSTTDLSTYLQAAINSLPTNGGTLYLPPGRYSYGTQLAGAEGVILEGAGEQTSTLRFTGAGNALKLGVEPSAVKRGMGVHNLGFLLTVKTASAMHLKGLVGCSFRNIYIEGPIEAARSTIGIIIDAYNASTYWNIFDTITMNHIETGFILQTTGAFNGTNQLFLNCSIFGDNSGVGTASVGFNCQASQGEGSVWIGGNMESMGIGFYAAASAFNVTVLGCRFESNTTDVRKEANSYPWTFIACNRLDVISDSTTGARASQYIGCITGSNLNKLNTFHGGVLSVADAAADVPGTFRGSSGQTGEILRAEASTGAVLFSVAADGNITAGAGSIATTATSGFLDIPSCAGVPTGAPSHTPWCPLIADTTNNRLYCYIGGAWRLIGP